MKIQKLTSLIITSIEIKYLILESTTYCVRYAKKYLYLSNYYNLFIYLLAATPLASMGSVFEVTEKGLEKSLKPSQDLNHITYMKHP